jgi:hypothetical protein
MYALLRGILFTDLWPNGNQIQHSFTTVHHIASYFRVYVTHKFGWWNFFKENLHFTQQPVFLHFYWLEHYSYVMVNIT